LEVLKLSEKVEIENDWENLDIDFCYYCNTKLTDQTKRKHPEDEFETICLNCLANWCNFCHEPKSPTIKVMKDKKVLKQFCNYNELQIRMMEEYTGL